MFLIYTFFFSFSKRFEEVTSTVRNANCETIVEAITDAMALSNGVPLILEACRTASVLACRDGPHHLQLWAHDIDAIFADIIFRRCSNKQSLLCNKEILEVDQHVWDILGCLVAYLPRQFRPKATGEFCRLDDLISFAWYTFKFFFFFVLLVLAIWGVFARYFFTGTTEVPNGSKYLYHLPFRT